MAHDNDFGIHTIVEFLTWGLGIIPAHVDYERKKIRLNYSGKYGTWQLFITLLEDGVDSTVMVHVPCLGSVNHKRRLACLEAFMAVNYKMAIGKYALDLEVGEIDLTAYIPVCNGRVSFEQFKLVYCSLLESVAMYRSLIPRILYGNHSVQESIKACEEEYDTQMRLADEPASQSQLNVADVLAEANRIFDEPKER